MKKSFVAQCQGGHTYRILARSFEHFLERLKAEHNVAEGALTSVSQSRGPAPVNVS